MKKIEVSQSMLENIGALAAVKIEASTILAYCTIEDGKFNLDELIGLISAALMKNIIEILFGDITPDSDSILRELIEYLN